MSFRVLGLGQLFGSRRIVEDIGECCQNAEMLVGFGRDSHNDVRNLAWPPLDSLRKLNHGNSRCADQLAVLGHAVRNRDSVTEVGIGLPFATDHALDVARLDIARFYENLSGSSNGFVLVRGARTDPNVLRGELNHGRILVRVLWI